MDTIDSRVPNKDRSTAKSLPNPSKVDTTLYSGGLYNSSSAQMYSDGSESTAHLDTPPSATVTAVRYKTRTGLFVQPFLKKQNVASSSSSSDEHIVAAHSESPSSVSTSNSLSNSPHSQLPPIPISKYHTAGASSTVPSSTSLTPSAPIKPATPVDNSATASPKKRPPLNDTVYSSSPNSEPEFSFGSQQSTSYSSPRSVETPISMAAGLPKFASPPAGSGGRYMVKSKRASWIDASAGFMQPHDGGTSSTLIILPDHSRPSTTRKSSLADDSHPSSPAAHSSQGEVLTTPADKHRGSSLEHQDLDSWSHVTGSNTVHKSGSLSKLRERRLPVNIPRAKPYRENSLDYSMMPSISTSSDHRPPTLSSSYDADIHKGYSFIDGNMADTEDTVSPDTQSLSSFYLRGTSRPEIQQNGSFYHGRTSSMSSVMTDASVITEDYGSSLLNHTFYPSLSNRVHQSISIDKGRLSPAHDSSPTSSSPVGGHPLSSAPFRSSAQPLVKKVYHRPSLSMARNVSTTSTSTISNVGRPS
ncbi:uncharacterized protein BYT42DRAFT_183351 [Radiomyces spectabilis]|uniref:uncharacterized protein n=1 Tax=Radiomyces spectabilis TaxID=64574 RepID=UPI002220FA78|nr:uncharacterized protein BYT42DRAFT_183351 [Radiomyces spectabilis]KAI8391143.1 hypothetical protein BYT42DRAFT_183351 [Radiomyces spectabilis]